MILDRRMLIYFDWLLLGLLVLVPCVSLVALYSAGYDPTSTGSPFGFIDLDIQSAAFLRHAKFLGIGFITLLIGLSVPSQAYFRYAYIGYVLCLLILVVVLLVGTEVNNSRSWLRFGGLNVQPSEFVKIGLILCLARYLSRRIPQSGGYGILQLFWPAVIVLIPAALIYMQNDLGTALTVAALGFAMVLFVGIRVKLLGLFGLLTVLSAYPVWTYFLQTHQKNRLLLLFNPDADPRGAGWHVTQSKIAVGSGGIFGKGFLQGTQTQLEFLPERTTDFIFSVFAEEWGFFGVLVVLGLYLGILYRLLRIVSKSKDVFSALVTFGVAFLIFFHTIVNIGMVIGLFPVIGLPLPLLSYGGSSTISVLLAFGVVLGMRMRRSIFVIR